MINSSLSRRFLSRILIGTASAFVLWQPRHPSDRFSDLTGPTRGRGDGRRGGIAAELRSLFLNKDVGLQRAGGISSREKSGLLRQRIEQPATSPVFGFWLTRLRVSGRPCADGRRNAAHLVLWLPTACSQRMVPTRTRPIRLRRVRRSLTRRRGWPPEIPVQHTRAGNVTQGSPALLRDPSRR